MKYRTAAAFICVLFAGAALWGCARVDPQAPPDVTYGVSVCADCGMIISDERYAAASLVDDPREGVTARLFDDTGDLLDWEHEHPAEKVLKRYVHDAGTKAWVEAEAAVYLVSEAIHTPMGSGIAAFTDAASAEAARAEHGGEIINLAALRARRNPAGNP